MNLYPRWGCLALGLAGLLLASGSCMADSPPDVGEQLRLLQQQNAALQQQLQQQQQLIDSLDHRLNEMQADSQKREAAQTVPAIQPEPKGFSLGKVILSGEAGVAFFRSGSEGAFPNSQFRVDEARLFVDAQVMNDAYFYAELNLITRENPSSTFHARRAVSWTLKMSRGCGGRTDVLNLRVGQLDIPFGEEYLHRDAIDNPLIMHSLSDLWGYDDGIELYGKTGKFQYVLGCFNGGISSLNDFNSDKAVVGRASVDPNHWLHLSVSGMRTGDLDVKGDQMSSLWFGNGFFRSIGNPATTKKFNADLVEGDVQVRLPRGYLKAAGGYAHYGDNDTTANNQRDIYYYYTEGLFNVTPKFYTVARFSQIMVPDGYPIVGNRNFGEYFFGSMTKNLWRLSLGVGYRLTPNLIWKTGIHV